MRDRRKSSRSDVERSCTMKMSHRAAAVLACLSLSVTSAYAAEPAAPAWMPPPISVDLKNATLPDVASALHHATGANFQPTIDDAGKFNLTVKDKSLWEIYTLLRQQAPLD